MWTWRTGHGIVTQLYRALFPAPPMEAGHAEWSDQHWRRQRYSVLWSFYDSTYTSGVWSEAIKREFGLYRNLRPVLNACGRIVEFHASHLYAGELNPEGEPGEPGATGGPARPAAVPVRPAPGADPGLASAVAAVLAASNFESRMAIYGRWGACLGDVGLEPVPDPKAGLVRLRVVHPAEVERVTLDPYGNVKSYVAERWEVDPEDPEGLRHAVYREVVANEDGTVRYATFKNGSEYAWPGTPGQTWTSRWGFVPLVLVKHIDVGNPWGVSELQNALAKTVERDDQASNLGDQVRKTVDAPWFLAGAALPKPPPGLGGSGGVWAGDPFCPTNPDGTPVATGVGGRANLAVVVQDRDGIPFFTCNSPDASVTSLVAPLPIKEAGGHIRSISDALEQEYPELVLDKSILTGDAASGSAIEKARQKAADKVHERRRGYDSGLRRALQMALTMGGDLEFPGFEGLGAGAFEAGRLDFSIAGRPVFTPTESELAARQNQRATATKTYASAGVPLGSALRLSGVCPADVAAVMADVAAQSAPPAAATNPPAPAGAGGDQGTAEEAGAARSGARAAAVDEAAPAGSSLLVGGGLAMLP